MANTPSEEEMARQASFIFKGKVLKLKASNVAQVEARDKSRTIIVSVEEIVEGPEAFADFKGREVTVKLRDDGGERLNAGDHAVFYTNGWIRAENLAVEEVGHRMVEDAGTDSIAASKEAAGHFSARDMRQRLSSADVVVKGSITDIRIPETEEPKLVGSSSLEKPARFFPTGEHEPKWREAVVRITEVLKGAHDQKEIVVRFPASPDARWNQAPLFSTGQDGIFILHKTRKTSDSAENRPPATATDEDAETTSTAYTALHPMDFQPPAQLEQIKKLVKESAGKD
ncbi:MAG TPA: hypothetical protein VM911_09980 [Pyrinomonadaceae bacterium]|jgi:hypothetical protein|nr:hypothetical protein [Pyrinomonadaceae bacterium]